MALATTLNLRLSPQLKTELETTADKYEIPMSSFVKILIRNFLKSEKKKLLYSITPQEGREIREAFEEYKVEKKKGRLKELKSLKELR